MNHVMRWLNNKTKQKPSSVTTLQTQSLVSYSSLFLLLLLLATWRLISPPCLTDFEQTWSQEPLTPPQPAIHPTWDQRSRSHRDQKCRFSKITYTSPPTDKVWSRDSCMCIMNVYQLDLFYKNYGSKNSSGVVSGQKGHFQKKKKMLLLLFDDMAMWPVYMNQLCS